MAAPPDAPRVRRSLRFKLTVGLIFIIAAVFAGINAFNLINHRATRFQEAKRTSSTIASLIAGSVTTQLADHGIQSASMRTFLSNFQGAVLTVNKDLAFLLVSTPGGDLVAGKARPDLIRLRNGQAFASSESALKAIAHLGRDAARQVRDVKMAQVTLVNPKKKKVGTLMVGASLKRVQAAWRRDLILNGTVFLVALFLIILYSSAALGRLVVNPLKRVVGAMRAVHSGDIYQELPVKSSDEIGVLSETYNYMLQGLRDRERLKDAFSRYVSKQVYEKFQRGEIAVEGETRQATVLFSDIRSFTSLSEQLTPQQVVAMLNEYFTEMVEIIFKYDGFLNKYIGDAIMAIYNVPIDQSQPELRAVSTAIEMIQALERLNARRTARGQSALSIGIGVNTGPVVAGNLGHEKRLEYTVIGDAVNLAQRIESQTKVAGTPVLISEETYRPITQYVRAQPLPPVKVKGKQEAVRLYAVTELLPEAQATSLSLPKVQRASG